MSSFLNQLHTKRHGKKYLACVFGLLVCITLEFMSIICSVATKYELQFYGTVSDSNNQNLVPLLRNNPNSIIYIKTYKTGSSTLSNLFHNFAVKRNKSILLNHFNLNKPLITDFLMRIFLYNNERTWNGNQIVDMWIYHTQFTPKLYKLVPGAEKQIVSIVRNPRKRYFSAWNYASDKKKPYNNLTEYLMEATHAHGNEGFVTKASLQFNSMCASFSIDADHDIYGNWKQIKTGNWLILIVDRWNESLLVLKYAYNLTWNDMVYVNQKQSSYKKKISKVNGQLIDSLNDCDWKLYNISVEMLNRRLDEIYDGDMVRKQEDIKTMETVRENVLRDCHTGLKPKLFYCISIQLDTRDWITKALDITQSRQDQYYHKLNWFSKRVYDFKWFLCESYLKYTKQSWNTLH